MKSRTLIFASALLLPACGDDTGDTMGAETTTLVWYAAYAFDHLPEERAAEAATAKAHVTSRAVETGRDAVELHGGIGFTWECDVQFWVKRTLFDVNWLGSPRAQRARLAALRGW